MTESKKQELNKIALFEGEEIRRVSFEGEWYFVIEDVVKALTDSKDPKQYLNKLRKRDEELSKGWVQSFNQYHQRKQSHLKDGWQE